MITAPWWDGNQKFAKISAATIGDNTLVAAVTGKKIRVLAMNFIMGAANNVYFTSGAGGTGICGDSTNPMKFGANGGDSLGFNAAGWFETAAGAALVANCSSTGPMSGCLVYEEVG